jgi:hypothetical protein
VHENAELRIRTWRTAVALLSVGMGAMAFSEVMGKLIGAPIPFSTSFLLYFFVSDLFIICFCLFQIRRIRKANVKNIDSSPFGANPVGKA